MYIPAVLVRAIRAGLFGRAKKAGYFTVIWQVPAELKNP